MKKWFNKNIKSLIITTFLIPIITIAIVSISHVTKWYEISNPLVWSQYLSFGIEIAALSALAAISTNIGKKVYFPFILVTLIQFIGNVFYSYLFININSKSFLSWVELVSPLLNLIGVEPNDLISHKRFLSFIEGGILPIISLSFLHMLVLYTNSIKNEKVVDITPKEIDIDNNSEINSEKPLNDVLTNDNLYNEEYSQNYIKVPSHLLKIPIEDDKKGDDIQINNKIKASLANKILRRR